MGLVCQMILQQGGDAADFFCIRVRGPAVGGRCCCHDSACSARFGLVWLISGSTRTPRCQVGHARQLRTVPVVRDGKSEPELVTLELERMGPHGFFGEACTVQQSKKVKQPNSVQAITNVTLTVLPAADFRDVLRMYPTVRSSIKAFLHRRCVVVLCAVCVRLLFGDRGVIARYPRDEALAAKVPGLQAWETCVRKRCTAGVAVSSRLRVMLILLGCTTGTRLVSHDEYLGRHSRCRRFGLAAG